MSLVTELQALTTRIATEFKDVRADLAGGGGGSTASTVIPTKKAIYAFGGAGESMGAIGTTFQNASTRHTILLPVTTKRWRVRACNRAANGTNGTAVINATGVWTGKATFDATGLPDSKFTETKNPYGAFTFDGTSDYVGAWVTDPAMQFAAWETYIWSIGWNATNSTGTAALGSGAGFWAATTDAPNGATGYFTYANTYFDIRIEYEFVGTQPVGIAIGDSLTEGTQAGQGTPTYVHSTWHQRVGQRLEIPMCASGRFGSSVLDWASTSTWQYTRWSATGVVPDFAIIQLGANDAFSVTTLANYQTRFATIFNNLKSLGIKKIYANTIAPRSLTSTAETARTDYNTWLRSAPVGLDGVFDVARAMENPTTPANPMTGLVSTTDNVHWTAPGHTVAATAINPGTPQTTYAFEASLGNEYNDTAMPSAPATGVKIFARKRARATLSVLGPNGQDSALQPALFSNRVSRLTVVNNVANPILDGLAVTPLNGPTLVPVATTNFYTSMVRHRYATTTTAGVGAGTRSTTGQWFLSSTPNMGGFFFVARLGLQTVTATNRLFIGMSGTTGAALSPTVDPTTLFNLVGFGCNASQTTWRFICNDASGTATSVDLGANFVTNVAATNFFEFRLFAPSGGGSQVHWSAQRLNDGVTVTGSATTDLPALNTLLAAHIHHSNGTTAAAATLDLQSLYIESDN